jgi:hypothetical protein
MDDIESSLELSEENEKKVVKAIEDFKATNTY